MKKIIFVSILIFISVSLMAQESENWQALNHNSALDCKNRILKLADDTRSFYRLRMTITYGENHHQEKNSIMVEQGYSTILVKMLYNKTGASFMYVEFYLVKSRTDLTDKSYESRLSFESDDEYLPKISFDKYFSAGSNKEIITMITQLFTSMGF